MQCNNTTIGTYNAVKTEVIDGGAVENEPSLYGWVARIRQRNEFFFLNNNLQNAGKHNSRYANLK